MIRFPLTLQCATSSPLSNQLTLAELNDFKATRGRVRTPKAVAKMKRFSVHVLHEVLLECARVLASLSTSIKLKEPV